MTPYYGEDAFAKFLSQARLDIEAQMDVLTAWARPFAAIAPESLRVLLDSCERADSVGPILYPSEYRSGAQRLGHTLKFLGAVEAFCAALEELRPEAEA